KTLVEEKTETVDRAEATGARELGVDPASGRPISVRLGRYGPMAQIGTKDDEEKPRFAGLRPGQSIHTITLEDALQLLHEKEEAARNRVIATFRDGAIQVLNGRYGPYITDGAKNARIPKDREPKSLTETECAELLAAAPDKSKRGGRFGRGAKGAAPKPVAQAPAAAKPAKKAAAKKAPA